MLAIFKMTGARSDVLIGSTNLLNGQPTKLRVNDPDGLEGARLPLAQGLGLFSDGAALAAISKAGTASFFSTQGSAISTRTASFIVQGEHSAGYQQPTRRGPLRRSVYITPCSDVRNPRDRNLSNLPARTLGRSRAFQCPKWALPSVA